MKNFARCLSILFFSLAPNAIALGEEPAELINSRTNYEKALDRVTAPIHQKYLEHLQRLQGKFIQENNLDAALAIRAEIEALQKQLELGVEAARVTLNEEPTGEESLQVWLQGREFRWEGTSVKEVVLTFKGDEVRVVADGREIMEKEFEIVSPMAFQFEWGTNDMNTFTIADGKRDFTRFMQGSRSTHGGTIRAK
tara:strand:+ start:4846 stop:5433 length:588 start_codon:yes stop_codon:yes gene_type:complete